MDFIFISLSLLASMFFLQNSEALGARHIEARRILRLMDNTVSGLSNSSRLLQTDGSNLKVKTTRGKPIRLYVEILEAGKPLTIFVEPQCGVTTKWTILLVEYTNSGNARKIIDVVHPQTKRKSYVKIIDAFEKGPTTELAGYVSKELSEFRLRSAPAGLYIVDLSTESPGNTIVAASQGKVLSLRYPVMPSDRKITLAKTSKTSFTFYWEKALLESEKKNSAGKMQYCVFVNNAQPVDNFCTAQKIINSRQNSVYFSECFYGRTDFTLTKDFSVATLYVSIFAVHPESNKSLAYDSIKISTPGVLTSTFLTGGSVINGKILRNKGYQILTYNNIERVGLKFSLVSCDTPITFCIAHNGKVIRCRLVSQEVDTFILRNAEPGKYIITLTSNKVKNGQFRFFVSTQNFRQPFPNLHRGRVIKEWPHARTCQSVTLAWIGVHGRQQYCLYVRRIQSSSSPRRTGLCWRAQDIETNEKVYCTYKRLRRREKIVFTKTIKNLQPCTKYEFVVQVKKIRASESLMYKPVRVVTKCRKC